jgi:hypothetical protein
MLSILQQPRVSLPRASARASTLGWDDGGTSPYRLLELQLDNYRVIALVCGCVLEVHIAESGLGITIKDRVSIRRTVREVLPHCRLF